MSVSEARAVWRTVGFTGSFSPSVGQNNKTVTGQSQPAGSCLSPGAPITVTYS
jgi:hypothetical protein